MSLFHESTSRYVIANDLSSSATAAMKRNVDLNGLGGEEGSVLDAVEGSSIPKLGKVRINEGDARYDYRLLTSPTELTLTEVR